MLDHNDTTDKQIDELNEILIGITNYFIITELQKQLN